MTPREPFDPTSPAPVDAIHEDRPAGLVPALIPDLAVETAWMQLALAEAEAAELAGAPDPKAGACGSVLDVIGHPHLNHRVEIVSGLLADRSSDLLTSFFRARR